MIVTSAEIRWFGRDPPPPGLDAFFEVDQVSVRLEEPREDTYLVPDSAWDEVGIKVRDGALEVKAPVGTGRSIILPHVESAVAKGWSKWSIKPELGDRRGALVAEFLRSGPVVIVKKVRRLRRYVPNWKGRVPGDALSVSAADPSATPKRACSVELTRLVLRRDAEEPREGWTFGFEAVGDDLDDAHAILRATVFAFLARLDVDAVTHLHGVNCLSYPAWLSMALKE